MGQVTQTEAKTRWELIDAAHIANTCSNRHIQSVIEDAQQTIFVLSSELLAIAELCEGFDGCPVSPGTIAARARAALAKAQGGV